MRISTRVVRPGTARVALRLLGLAWCSVGLSQFIAHVPASSWLRVGVWFGGGILTHDALLAPLAVVLGWLVPCRSPTGVRKVLRFLALMGVTVTVLAAPLLASGGLRT